MPDRVRPDGEQTIPEINSRLFSHSSVTKNFKYKVLKGRPELVFLSLQKKGLMIIIVPFFSHFLNDFLGLEKY
jgi:hypothetical protein